MKEKIATCSPILIAAWIVWLGNGVPRIGDSSAKSTPAAPPAEQIVLGGEELDYEVSWGFIKLGTIRLKTFPNYTARAYVDSYNGQPSVDLHSVNETKMDSSFFSCGSWGIEKRENSWWGLNYRSDSTNKRVVVEEMYQKDVQSQPYRRQVQDTLPLSGVSYLDGLSVVYYPRAQLHSARSVDAPVIVSGKLGTVSYHFGSSPVTVRIDVLDNLVRVIEVDGKLSANGIFGVTGDFKGWFSDDKEAVPIKGKLKVLIGSVTVELIKWKRSDWEPPK